LSRLIVISNRVSAPTPQQPSAQGGLAVALTAALREAFLVIREAQKGLILDFPR
jgi:hypothetical protein